MRKIPKTAKLGEALGDSSFNSNNIAGKYLDLTRTRSEHETGRVIYAQIIKSHTFPQFSRNFNRARFI